MNIITAESISMSYEGKKVLDNVSFKVEDGDCLLILGENGSGKTTLLKALTGLKKIDSGRLNYGPGFKQNEIGYLPQQTQVQRDFPASVEEVVISGCINRMGLFSFYTKKQKSMAKNAMKRLEIEGISKKCYHSLSGGQQQRVLLARALCASQNLLILDEPTTGLDTGASKEFYQLISALNKEGKTVVMISHDIQNALGCATKVLHLGDERPLFFGDIGDYSGESVKGGKKSL